VLELLSKEGCKTVQDLKDYSDSTLWPNLNLGPAMLKVKIEKEFKEKGISFLSSTYFLIFSNAVLKSLYFA
jgi:hypothetical protein